jgi:hypothetical protein
MEERQDSPGTPKNMKFVEFLEFLLRLIFYCYSLPSSEFYHEPILSKLMMGLEAVCSAYKIDVSVPSNLNIGESKVAQQFVKKADLRASDSSLRLGS